MRVLFINDQPAMYEVLQLFFQDRNDIAYAECHSVDEALTALMSHQPNLVFLDHALTRDGEEGWQIFTWICRHLPQATVITTTYNVAARERYQAAGVRYLDLADLDGVKAAVEAGDQGQSRTASHR